MMGATHAGVRAAPWGQCGSLRLTATQCRAHRSPITAPTTDHCPPPPCMHPSRGSALRALKSLRLTPTHCSQPSLTTADATRALMHACLGAGVLAASGGRVQPSRCRCNARAGHWQALDPEARRGPAQGCGQVWVRPVAEDRPGPRAADQGVCFAISCSNQPGQAGSDGRQAGRTLHLGSETAKHLGNAKRQMQPTGSFAQSCGFCSS